MSGARSTDIQLICFDLGHVLIHVRSDWHEACRIAGVTLDPARLTSDVTAAIREAIIRNEVGLADQQRFTQELAPLLGLTPQEVHRVTTAWLDRPYPGVMELLERLLAQPPAPLACLSNTNEHHWTLMTRPGGPHYLPLDRFHFRFASHQLGTRKPQEAIYQHVEQASGVDPRSILFFDNLAPNVEAAAARRWRTCHIDQNADPVPQIIACLRGYDLLPPDRA